MLDCCPVAYWGSRVLLAVIACCLLSAAEPPQGDAKDDKGESTQPSELPGPKPEYTAEQVVQIVMDSLQNNDAKDSGIATTFNFASPGNKELTGPLKRFIPMVKTPQYKPMLNFKSAEYDEIQTEGDQAQQRVTIVSGDGETAVYVFSLSKQPDGEFKDCWMTDGVIRVEATPRALHRHDSRETRDSRA